MFQVCPSQAAWNQEPCYLKGNEQMSLNISKSDLSSVLDAVHVYIEI